MFKVALGRLHERWQVEPAQPVDATPTCWPTTSCSPRSTPPRASSSCRRDARSPSPTRSVSSRSCRPRSVEAFKSTLDEITGADLILHVVDASSEEREAQRAAVEDVLGQIEAQGSIASMVYNKVDLLGRGASARHWPRAIPQAQIVSAATGQGIDGLVGRIARAASLGATSVSEVVIPYERGDLVSVAHERCHILSEKHGEDGTRIVMLAPLPAYAGHVQSRYARIVRESELLRDYSKQPLSRVRSSGSLTSADRAAIAGPAHSTRSHAPTAARPRMPADAGVLRRYRRRKTATTLPAMEQSARDDGLHASSSPAAGGYGPLPCRSASPWPRRR